MDHQHLGLPAVCMMKRNLTCLRVKSFHPDAGRRDDASCSQPSLGALIWLMLECVQCWEGVRPIQQQKWVVKLSMKTGSLPSAEEIRAEQSQSLLNIKEKWEGTTSREMFYQLRSVSGFHKAVETNTYPYKITTLPVSWSGILENKGFYPSRVKSLLSFFSFASSLAFLQRLGIRPS